MFDFNAKAFGTGVIAGAALLGGAQQAQAVTVQQNVPFGVLNSSISGAPATYEFGFAGIADASKVTFGYDGGEGGFFGQVYEYVFGGSPTGEFKVELKLDDVWTQVDSIGLDFAGTAGVDIVGNMYSGFGPSTLSGLRLSVTPDFAVPGTAAGAISVFGSPAYLLVETAMPSVPEPATAGLMALAGGALFMRRRRKDGVVSLRLDENPDPRRWDDRTLG